MELSNNTLPVKNILFFNFSTFSTSSVQAMPLRKCVEKAAKSLIAGL